MTETFKHIIKKIIKTDNNFFSINHDSSDKVDKIIKLLFVTFIFKEINTKKKFEFFFENIQNTFLKNVKHDFINYFCTIQKTYYGFNKLARIFKYKISKTVINFDIGLNEINENQKNVIGILHLNSKYLFSINDLINIINTSLTNNYEFFAEPLCIKNPYNNIPFSKSILYNIYFFILYKTYYRPELFINFFSCNFSLSLFGKKYEIVLREYSIKNYVYKSPLNILFKEVTKMIKKFNNYCLKFNLNNKIIIDKEFPQDTLVKIMQPYLLVYFTSLYSMIPNKKYETNLVFKHIMLKFNKFNPVFGRKRYKILFKHNASFKKKIISKIIEFDDRHIVFNDKNNKTNDFLIDHLLYKESFNTLNYYFTNLLIVNNDNQEYFQNHDTDNNDEEDADDADNNEAEDEDNDDYQGDEEEIDSIS
jgi:hypothetical protein